MDFITQWVYFQYLEQRIRFWYIMKSAHCRALHPETLPFKYTNGQLADPKKEAQHFMYYVTFQEINVSTHEGGISDTHHWRILRRNWTLRPKLSWHSTFKIQLDTQYSFVDKLSKIGKLNYYGISVDSYSKGMKVLFFRFVVFSREIFDATLDIQIFTSTLPHFLGWHSTIWSPLFESQGGSYCVCVYTCI